MSRRRAIWASSTKKVPFDNDESKAQPLMEHLRRSFHYTVDHLGPHGLPLIGRADWNDCLNLNCFSKTPGESFQTTANFESGVAESLFIAGMFVGVCPDYEELCRRYGWNEEARGRRWAQSRDGKGRARTRLGRRVVPARL